MTKGIHHITAISSDPQKTYDFYSKVLGLRLVKKTVNQDDTKTYHLFFGDRLGHPGMDLTFFTFQPSRPGKNSNGFVSKISFSVAISSIKFWEDRFSKQSIKYKLDGNKIAFEDFDGQKLELVGMDIEVLEEYGEDVWFTDEIGKDNAIRCFHSATLMVSDTSLIEPILIGVFGYKRIETYNDTYIYEVENSTRANLIQVEIGDDDYGISGAGTVHHIAFRAKDLEEELVFRNKLESLGIRATEVIDRFYFKSVYFRTPAGILFEIATDEPGFTADQKERDLGKVLSLPPFLESERNQIESNLTPINL